MQTSPLIYAAAAVITGLAAYATISQTAHAQLPNGNAGTYTPIGVATTAQGSTAWFIDTTKNQVVKCSDAPGRSECVSLRIP